MKEVLRLVKIISFNLSHLVFTSNYNWVAVKFARGDKIAQRYLCTRVTFVRADNFAQTFA